MGVSERCILYNLLPIGGTSSTTAPPLETAAAAVAASPLKTTGAIAAHPSKAAGDGGAAEAASGRRALWACGAFGALQAYRAATCAAWSRTFWLTAFQPAAASITRTRTATGSCL